ncbi:Ig-like domain-containing protein, partial [Thiotrichales bacterium 19S11-10]|nr:Ig-like domain-containing protein [Thiotrichales bacterium 19S11-10]
NDAPDITIGGGSAAESLTETDTTLSTSGTLVATDVDLTDVVTLGATTIGTSGNVNSISDASFLSMFSITGDLTSAETTDSLSWSFNSNGEAFDYLASGETLVLTYTVSLIDDHSTPASDTQDVVITITGTNDAPDITIGGGSAAESLTETDTTLSTSGTLVATDVDLTDVVTLGATTIGTSGNVNSISDASFLSMFSITGDLTSAETTDSLSWSFNSNGEAFDYLASGETLVLTYTVSLIDDHSTPASDTQDVVITITGTNDAPDNNAPVAIPSTINLDEDTTYVFSVSDFNFTDVDGDELSSIRITSLSSDGSLQLDGSDVSLNQVIIASDISDGLLTFSPTENSNGLGYDNFEFSVSDGFTESENTTTVTVNVSPINDAPTATLSDITFDEDTTYVFSISDFNFTDVDGDELSSIRITSLSSDGSLQLDGSDVGLNQVVIASDISSGLLTFSPTENSNGLGYDSFEFRASDGSAESENISTLTVDVTPVNDAPIVSLSDITFDEDTTYVFSISDFNFTDVDGDELSSIRVTSLSGDGVLQLNGSDVSLNQVIIASDISDGLLTFSPTENSNGLGYDNFEFSVSDGFTESENTSTVTVDVTPVNDAPVATLSKISFNKDSSYTFSLSDFEFTDVDGDTLESIRVTSLGNYGSLSLDGNAVSLNQVITASDISEGLLIFSPTPSNTGIVGYDSFEFSVSDGSIESTVSSTLTVDIYKLNNASVGVAVEKVIDLSAIQEVEVGEIIYTVSSSALDISANTAPETIYTIMEEPQYGTIRNTNLNINLGVNDTFTQADIDFNYISYTNDGVDLLPDSFTFFVSLDGGATVNSYTVDLSYSEVYSFAINIDLVSQIMDVAVNGEESEGAAVLVQAEPQPDVENETDDNILWSLIGATTNSDLIIRISEEVIKGTGSELNPYILNASGAEKVFLAALFQDYNTDIEISGINLDKSSVYLLVNVNENDIFITAEPNFNGEVKLKVRLSNNDQVEEVYYTIKVSQNAENLNNQVNLEQSDYIALFPGENSFTHLWGNTSDQSVERAGDDFNHALNSQQPQPVLENIVSRLLTASLDMGSINQSVQLVVGELIASGMKKDLLVNLSVHMILDIKSKVDRTEIIKSLLANQNLDEDLLVAVYNLLAKIDKEVAEEFIDELARSKYQDVIQYLANLELVLEDNVGYLEAIKAFILSGEDEFNFKNLDIDKEEREQQSKIQEVKKKILSLFKK